MASDRINKVIIDYLETKDTSYALMLSGKWGCGKTYYWKNYISSNIVCKTLSANDKNEQKYYKPIYISLYGVENVSDISKRIFLELMPLNGESKAVKIISSLGSKVVSAASSFFNIGDLKIEAEDLNNMYNLSNCTFVFDDLERISGDEDLLGKILGFINYLSEHDHIKVLILANEDELLDKYNGNWAKAKEKIINQSVPFEVDYREIVENIIDSFDKFKKCHEYLKSNIELVLKALINSKTNNLRTLKYGIERFKTLYNLFEKEDELDFLDTYGKSILYYILVIAFEAKSGKIDVEDKFEISKLSYHGISNRQVMENLLNPYGNKSNKEESKSEKEEYQEEFIKKYYSEEELIICQRDLFNFILTSLYDVDLVKVLKNSYLPTVLAPTPQLEVWNELQRFTINGISQRKLNKGVDQITRYARNGEYHLMYYPMIYGYCYQLNDLKLYHGLDLEKLMKVLVKGIEKANLHKENRIPPPFIGIHWGEGVKDDNILKKRYFELINSNKEEDFKRYSFEFIRNLENQPKEALEMVFDKNKRVSNSSLFYGISLKKFMKLILNLNNTDLIDFDMKLEARFSMQYEGDENDKEVLKTLEEKLSEYIKSRKTYDLKLYHLEHLVKTISNIVKS
eukprot:TRINITY_DN18183_c0_g3_i1.p1 TRINITY_DN18183_c0_g3~~TRINITY_DN18183_c0_g3_i1.p1  ORF type:complete len:627 (+),score=62.81 TRINITY_DN18183_c0_g3_i1:5357-7237(+)